MTYAAPSRLPLPVLWLLLFAIVFILGWANALVAERVIDFGWRGALESRRGYLLPIFPLLTLFCLPFLASSAQHFVEFGRRVVLIKDGRLYRAGYAPLALADIVGVTIDEGRHGPWVMAATRSGRRCFVSPWFAGPDADTISIELRRALEQHRASSGRP